MSKALTFKKLAELNAHELQAVRLVREACNDIIGGLQNTLWDNKPEEEDYINAKNFLQDAQAVEEQIHSEVLAEAKRLKFAKHLKFAGNEFLLEYINRRVTRDLKGIEYK